MTSFLITGSSRGLGFALVSRLASLPESEVGTIFATARQDNSAQLNEVIKASNGRVQFVQLDVTNQASTEEAARVVEGKLNGQGLDYLVNNVGMADWAKGNLDGMNNLNELFNMNVTSVHQVTQAFLPLVRKGEKKIVINISTTLGSISRAHVYKDSPTPAYKVSKAALNMLNVQYDLQYAKEGLSFVLISPGWLRTDLGSQFADLPVEVGAEKVVDIILQTGPHQSGKHWNIHVPGWEHAEGKNQYEGKVIEW